MNPEELVSVLRDPEQVSRNSFAILRELARIAAEDAAVAQDLLLRALEQRAHFGAAGVVLDGFVREAGLFPYLDPDTLSLRDRIAHEYHKPSNMSDDVVFHRVQAEVYRLLMDGRSVILSAPTSFGKSLLVDAVVASQRYRNIAVIVPTIALIDETRRRLAAFRDRYKVITHPTQPPGDRNIFVITQERIQEFRHLDVIDFFVIDEFYKLHPDPEDEGRSMMLNHAFYMLLKTRARFYLLGPNIRDIPPGFDKKYDCAFIRTDYKTVSSQTLRVRPATSDGEDQTLISLCKTLQEPTLIFCSSPGRTRKVAHWLLDAGVTSEQPDLSGAAEWVAKEYHPEWLFGRALQHGIGIHHGKIPRALAQYAVRMFNDGAIRFLICTSTLIEGVNTKAKNIIVFDNKIFFKEIDFFTFNNIRGRSGRMFEHFVGNVFLFHDPPAHELPFIDIPWFSQDEQTSDSLLVQMATEDLQDAARDRVKRYGEQELLSIDIIRQNIGIDPATQVALAQHLKVNAATLREPLSWRGMPKYDQLLQANELIWQFFVGGGRRRRAGISSGRQLTYRIWQTQQKTIRQLIDQDMANPNAPAARTPDDVVEDTFEFLRHWVMFNFPRYLMALSRIQAGVFGKGAGDYSAYASRIEHMGMDPALFALDEYGIPWQTAQRLASVLSPRGDFDVALARLRELQVDRLRLSDFERALVQDAAKYV
jgi:hypothetical protein